MPPLGSAHEFSAEVESRTASQHGIVGDERDSPADCSGSNPQICVAGPLMQRVTDHSAVVAQLRHPLDCLFVDR
jgi:hypothetical protein